MANTTKKTTNTTSQKKTDNSAQSSMASQVEQQKKNQPAQETQKAPEQPKQEVADTKPNKGLPWPDNLYQRYGVGEKNITFQLQGTRIQNWFMKPKSTVLYQNKRYRLRYAKNLDTPFIIAQPEDISESDVVLNYIRWENGLFTAKKHDPCLQKFLLVHPENETMGGKKFKVLEQEVEDQKYLELDEKRDSVKQSIRSAPEEKIRAAYTVIFSPQKAKDADQKTLVKDLIQLVNDNPQEVERVEDVMSDEKTYLKYKYYKLISKGLVEHKYDKVMWEGSKGVITKVPKGQDPAETFANELTKSSNVDLRGEIDRLLKK